MNKLEKVYRDAPKAASPADLDQRILRAAESRVPPSVAKSKSERASSRWWMLGHAVSYLCIFGIGLGVLLQSGMMPFGGNNDTATQDTITADAEVAHSSKEDVALVTDIARDIETRKTAISPSEQFRAELEAAPLADASDAGVFAEPATINSVEKVVVEEDIVPQLQQQTATESVSVLLSESTPAATAVTGTQAPNNPGPADVVKSETAIDENTAQVRSRNTIVNVGASKVRSADWLLVQNPDSFTVQLAVAKDQGALSAAVASHTAITVLQTDQLQLQSGTSASAFEWLLLHGSFVDRTEAERVAAELLIAIAKVQQSDAQIKPQILSFKEIWQRLE